MLISGMVIAVAALLVFLDIHESGKAEQLYQQAQQVAKGRLSLSDMRREVHKGWIIVHAYHVPADLCYAFTGGLRFSILLPRSRHIQDRHPTVSSASGSCARGDVNTLLFTFSATAP